MNELFLRKRSVPRDFDSVAPTYDLLTGLNPGYHRHLRMSARRMRVAGRAPRILDLCCGTGASTEAIVREHPDAHVVALDASPGMLQCARRKPVLRGVEFVLGDATDPAAAGIDGGFDGVLMAYGIRNVPDPDRALANVLALLNPGARAVLHEYSVADSLRSTIVWEAVCLGVIRPSGFVTAPASGIYSYLHRSVRDFDGVRALEARMRRAGFAEVSTEPMDGWQRGIVHSFVGRRPA